MNSVVFFGLAHYYLQNIVQPIQWNNYNMSLVDQFLQQHKPISVSPSLCFDLRNMSKTVSSMIDNLAQMRTSIPSEQKKIIIEKQENYLKKAQTLGYLYQDIEQETVQINFDALLQIIDPNSQNQWFSLFLAQRKPVITIKMTKLLTKSLNQCGQRPRLHQNSFKTFVKTLIDSIQQNGKVPKQVLGEIDLHWSQLFNKQYFQLIKSNFNIGFGTFLQQLKYSQLEMNSKFDTDIETKLNPLRTFSSDRQIVEDIKQSRLLDENMAVTQQIISTSRTKVAKHYTPIKIIERASRTMESPSHFYYNQACVKTSNRWLDRYR